MPLSCRPRSKGDLFKVISSRTDPVMRSGRTVGISGAHEPLRMKDFLIARPLPVTLRLRAKFMLLERSLLARLRSILRIHVLWVPVAQVA